LKQAQTKEAIGVTDPSVPSYPTQKTLREQNEEWAYFNGIFYRTLSVEHFFFMVQFLLILSIDVIFT